MLQKLLLVWLVLSSLVAFYWTTWFAAAPDPFRADVNAVVLKWLIVVTMFAIGWMFTGTMLARIWWGWPLRDSKSDDLVPGE